MTEAWVAIAFTVAGNIIAWVYTYGKLNQKVQSLAAILENGICKDVTELSKDLAYLKGIIEGLTKQISVLNETKP